MVWAHKWILLELLIIIKTYKNIIFGTTGQSYSLRSKLRDPEFQTMSKNIDCDKAHTQQSTSVRNNLIKSPRWYLL